MKDENLNMIYFAFPTLLFHSYLNCYNFCTQIIPLLENISWLSHSVFIKLQRGILLEFKLWSCYNSLYPALVLFEQQNCIDRINVYFIQSLTEYHFFLWHHYMKPWNDVKFCNVLNLIKMLNVTHLGSHNHI